ncbi:MAG TPA: hypothetical protein VGQ78_05585 [Vicinamibacteria bacterium]|jgi:hypothetical protein|nr:hypothetical protein [Vicinamibacteria bacterium]
MRPPARAGARVDELHAELLKAGESVPRLRALLDVEVEETAMIGLLRRAVPVRFLELLADAYPWSDRPRVLAGIVLNRRAPRTLSLRLLPALFWRDLADVAANAHLSMAVRSRAEALLQEKLPEMRLGERIALGKIATPRVLAPLLGDPDPKVARASLINPRLREQDLLLALQSPTAPVALMEAVAASPRWSQRYGVKLGLVLQARTPLGIALAQLSSLLPRDLARVGGTEGLRPLVQAAALRVAREASP